MEAIEEKNKEKRIIIDVGKLTYEMVEDGESRQPYYPLPVGVDWEGEVELIGRFVRTGGGGADWNIYNIELSKSHQSPRIHIGGKARIQTDSCRELIEEDTAYPVLHIYRKKGYEGRNIHIRIDFLSEIINLTKRKERERYIKSIWEKVKDSSPGFCQGHLNGWYLDNDVELPMELTLFGRKYRILNHEFLSDKNFKWIGYDYNAVIHCPKGVKIFVISPDHLDVPHTLTWGYYFFTHPEPADAD